MHNCLKYLLLTSAIAGCTIETVEKSDAGGASSTGGAKATGGATDTTGGKTSAIGGATGSSVGGQPGTSTGGSAATGGASAAGGTAASGGSTAITTEGGASAIGGSTAATSTSPSGGASAVGGAEGLGGSTVVATGGSSSVGGGSADIIGGTTAVSTSPSDGGTSLPTVRLDLLTTCDVVAPTNWTKAVYDTSDCGVVTVLNALTIEAGSIIKFAPGGYFDVSNTGTLKAVGTENEPIVFTSIKDDARGGDTGGDGATSPTRGDWGCDSGCSDVDLAGSGSQLDYVQILYGFNGLRVQKGASVELTNSTFAHHAGYGAVLDEEFNAGATTVTGNAFYDNGSFPLYLGEFISLDASNVFHDPADPAIKNTKQCIEVSRNSSVNTAVSIGVTELAFYGSFVIDSALTVADGVCFKPEMGGEIDLNAAGSIVNGANAIFTSSKDDSVGGDCTGDGTTTPANADWEGIWVTTSTDTDWAAPTANIRYTDQVNNPGTLPLH